MIDMRLLLKGDKRQIARVISTVENDPGDELLRRIFPHTGKAYNIGVTGPPGAGKSTLVNALTKYLLEKRRRVGIIAVDPSSPFSGGALLGDRVRMADLSLEKNVFIRSMATRGSLGGLARATKDVALVFDAAGMDYVIIETIGVGQVELDIAEVCDTTVVVLVPESGDSIQAMKAGLLEIADIMVVNKGDREGSERLVTELKFAFEMREQRLEWECPILRTVATSGEGVAELAGSIASHMQYLSGTGRLEQQRKEKLMHRVHELVENRIRSHLERSVLRRSDLADLTDRMYRRRLDPYGVAERITKAIIRGRR